MPNERDKRKKRNTDSSSQQEDTSSSSSSSSSSTPDERSSAPTPSQVDASTQNTTANRPTTSPSTPSTTTGTQPPATPPLFLTGRVTDSNQPAFHSPRPPPSSQPLFTTPTRREFVVPTSTPGPTPASAATSSTRTAAPAVDSAAAVGSTTTPSTETAAVAAQNLLNNLTLNPPSSSSSSLSSASSASPASSFISGQGSDSVSASSQRTPSRESDPTAPPPDKRRKESDKEKEKEVTNGELMNFMAGLTSVLQGIQSTMTELSNNRTLPASSTPPPASTLPPSASALPPPSTSTSFFGPAVSPIPAPPPAAPSVFHANVPGSETSFSLFPAQPPPPPPTLTEGDQILQPSEARRRVEMILMYGNAFFHGNVFLQAVVKRILVTRWRANTFPPEGEAVMRAFVAEALDFVKGRGISQKEKERKVARFSTTLMKNQLVTRIVDRLVHGMAGGHVFDDEHSNQVIGSRLQELSYIDMEPRMNTSLATGMNQFIRLKVPHYRGIEPSKSFVYNHESDIHELYTKYMDDCLDAFYTEEETKRHFADELRRLNADLWSSATMLHGEHHTYTGWRAALECFHRLVNDEKRSSARIPPTSSFQIGVRGQEKSCEICLRKSHFTDECFSRPRYYKSKRSSPSDVYCLVHGFNPTHETEKCETRKKVLADIEDKKRKAKEKKRKRQQADKKEETPTDKSKLQESQNQAPPPYPYNYPPYPYYPYPPPQYPPPQYPPPSQPQCPPPSQPQYPPPPQYPYPYPPPQYTPPSTPPTQQQQQQQPQQQQQQQQQTQQTQQTTQTPNNQNTPQNGRSGNE